MSFGEFANAVEDELVVFGVVWVYFGHCHPGGVFDVEGFIGNSVDERFES